MDCCECKTKVDVVFFKRDRFVCFQTVSMSFSLNEQECLLNNENIATGGGLGCTAPEPEKFSCVICIASRRDVSSHNIPSYPQITLSMPHACDKLLMLTITYTELVTVQLDDCNH